MRVGSLEIQLMADMARLSKDMKRAEQVVGGSMMKVESSVAKAKQAMQALGVGLPLAMITDQVRRMTDSYTKLDAQLRLATKSQQQYAQGMTDVRRISAIAQSDINATSMLYTRLMNVMDGTGVSQAKIATVTETVSFGLKAYGASAQEASSAALQLSQAMGANRLGGEEFRAVMEAMPNVMKVLATSMGVPLGELRALSIAGKITADEMVKAFGNPAIAAEFKRLAENARTITGAWVVARNEFMLLVGEFMKSSGATGAAMAVFDGLAVVIKFLADNMNVLLNLFTAYVSVLAGKFVMGLVQARMAQMALNAAHVEAIAVNLAQADAALFAAKANLAGAAAAARAGGSMKLAAAAAREYAVASAAVARAEAAQAASSIGIAGRIKGAVGKAGWIGMALFGVWTVYDFLNGMQQVADGADKLKNKFEGLTLAEVQMARQKELIRQIGMRGMFQDDSAIQNSQDMIRAYDAQIAKLAAVANAETSAAQVKQVASNLSHDEEVMQMRMIELAGQYNEKKLTEAEYLKRVNEALYGRVKAQKEVIALTPAELQARNDAEVAAASFEFWKKDDERRLEAEAKAEADALASRQKQHEDFWKSIDKTAHDTFVSILDGGKDIATRLRDMFKNIFFDWLYQMTVKKWIVSISASFAPTAASAAGGAASSAIGGAAGGSMGGLILANGNLSTGAIMGLTAAAAVVGVGLLAKYGFGFGNGPERLGDQRLSGQFSRSGFSGGMEQDWRRNGGWFGSSSSWTERTALTTAQHKAFEATVDGLQTTFNSLGSAIGDTGIKTREWTVDVNQAGYTTGMLADDIGTQLVPALQDLRMEGETLADTAIRLTSVFQSTNDFIAALGLSSIQAFGGAGVASASQRADLVAAAGGEQAFAQMVGTFMSSILTPAEQLQVSLNDVGRVFAELNIVGVETNAQFAELVRQALQGGDYSTVGALLSVSDAFASITKSAATATDQLLALVKASSFSTFADYQRMMSSITASAAQPTVSSGVIASATAAAGGTLAQEQLAADSARRTAEKAAALREYETLLASGAPVMDFGDKRYLSKSDKLAQARVVSEWEANVATALAYYESLPAFASGGIHSGGMRLVGENGPEIEYTGPSTIVSNSDSRKMFDNSGVIASVDALRAELRAVGVAVAASTQKTAKILDRWDGQGTPEVREAA